MQPPSPEPRRNSDSGQGTVGRSHGQSASTHFSENLLIRQRRPAGDGELSLHPSRIDIFALQWLTAADPHIDRAGCDSMFPV